MKHLLSNLHRNRHFLYCLLAVVFTSCNPEPIENHKGSIVYQKQNLPAGMRFELKYKDKDGKYDFRTVYVLELDWNKYSVGDTIK
jgi:hypothetical protein